MAVDATPWLLGSATHDKRIPRRMTQAVFGGPMQTFAGAVLPTTGGGAHGVVGNDDLKVTISSGLTMAVAAGTCVLTGPLLGQGAYTWGQDAASTIALTAHAANPRIDLVCVQVQDNDEDSSGAETAAIVKIDGTPAASPAVPAIPAAATYLVLAEILVPATSGAVTITDRRPYAAAVGGTQRITSQTTLPTGAARQTGVEVYDLATKSKLIWDGTAWNQMWNTTATAWTPTYTLLTVGNGTVAADWRYISPKTVQARWRLTLGSTSVVGTSPTLTLPVAPATHIDIDGTPVLFHDITGSRFAGIIYQVTGAQIGLLANVVSGTAIAHGEVTATVPFTWTTGDLMHFSVVYSVA